MPTGGQELEAGPHSPNSLQDSRQRTHIFPPGPGAHIFFLSKCSFLAKRTVKRGKSHRLKEEEEEEKKEEEEEEEKKEEEEESRVCILESNLGERATFLPAEATVKPSGARAESTGLLGLFLKQPCTSLTLLELFFG